MARRDQIRDVNLYGVGTIGRGKGQEIAMADESWVRGKRIKYTRGHGKGREEGYYWEGDRDKTFRPAVAQKTGAGVYTSPYEAATGKEYVAGANVLDQEGRSAMKAMTFEESLATGNRADDPRNWEYHYKDPGNLANMGPTKGMSATERRQQRFARARRSAEKMAKLAGEEIYETLKAEYDIGRIRDETSRMKSQAKVMGPGEFGSTRVAQNVEAARRGAARSVARGRGQQTTSPFQAQAARGARTMRSRGRGRGLA